MEIQLPLWMELWSFWKQRSDAGRYETQIGEMSIPCHYYQGPTRNFKLIWPRWTWAANRRTLVWRCWIATALGRWRSWKSSPLLTKKLSLHTRRISSSTWTGKRLLTGPSLVSWLKRRVWKDGCRTNGGVDQLASRSVLAIKDNAGARSCRDLFLARQSTLPLLLQWTR